MRMRALDSFCPSAIGMLHAGTEFDVDDATGQIFQDRGMAVVVAGATPPKAKDAVQEAAKEAGLVSAEKVAPVAENKMAPAHPAKGPKARG